MTTSFFTVSDYLALGVEDLWHRTPATLDALHCPIEDAELYQMQSLVSGSECGEEERPCSKLTTKEELS